MAITATLVESTPYRLRFLLDGLLADTALTISNATLVAALDASAGELRSIITAPAATQAVARARLCSDDPTDATLTNNNVPRAFMEVTPRSGLVAWAADAGSDGTNATVVIAKAAGTAGTAYLDIKARHTFDL